MPKEKTLTLKLTQYEAEEIAHALTTLRTKYLATANEAGRAGDNGKAESFDRLDSKLSPLHLRLFDAIAATFR